MATIPLEDTFTDIVGKARRGLKLTDDQQLAAKAGVSAADVAKVSTGGADENVLRKLAPALNLGAQSLVDSATKKWYPPAQQVEGLQQFNTPFEDMTVNAYLIWDPKSREAVAFDTGATCQPMLDFAKSNGLSIKLILLTHTHPDHIADLAKLKAATGVKAYVGELEPNPGAELFPEGRVFKLGNLKIETRLTTGHCVGGITFVVSGLARPVAVVGDAREFRARLGVKLLRECLRAFLAHVVNCRYGKPHILEPSSHVGAHAANANETNLLGHIFSCV